MQSVIKSFNIKGHKKKIELTDQDTMGYNIRNITKCKIFRSIWWSWS